MRIMATVAMACSAALAIQGCSAQGDGGRMQIDALTAERDESRAALEEARKTLDRAEEALGDARAALDALQGSLGAAQDALSEPVEKQRDAAGRAVVAARTNLQAVRQELVALPDSEAKTAADGALVAIDAALTLTAEALAVSPAASGGAVSPASMHTTLDRAQNALDTAQARLKTALAAEPPAMLRGLLSQAQATLTTAQVSLVPLLRRELADAETAAAAQRARAESAEAARDREKTRADAEKARAEGAEAERDALTDEYISPPLFDSARTPGTLGETITLDRTARAVTNAAGDAWVASSDALDIATDAVPYASGRTLTSRAGDEEFPMRAITFRGEIVGGADRGGDANTAAFYPIIQGAGNALSTAGHHTKNAIPGSVRLTDDGGLTIETGGAGVVFNEFLYDIRGTEYDGPDGIPGDSAATTATTATAHHVAMFRRAGETPPEVGSTLTAAQAASLTGWATDNCAAGAFPCRDGNMRDMTIGFGAPSLDPDDDAGYYWQSKIPSSEGQPEPAVADAMHADAQSRVERFLDSDRGAGEYRGEYRLWLSNYAGMDGMGTDDASDDEARFLSYAAYGLFVFTDYLAARVEPGRMQGFHFGYDAFADADGMRTTDLDSPINATFTGRTSAMVMHPYGRTTVRNLTRLRGDVTLTAVIGGANTITGEITNFETPRAGGGWRAYGRLEHIQFREGRIAADGSYSGEAGTDYTSVGSRNNWDPGGFGGNLYGDSGGDLETAGWWWLKPQGYTGGLSGSAARLYVGRPDWRYAGAFGSFGAECTDGCD